MLREIQLEEILIPKAFFVEIVLLYHLCISVLILVYAHIGQMLSTENAQIRQINA